LEKNNKMQIYKWKEMIGVFGNQSIDQSEIGRHGSIFGLKIAAPTLKLKIRCITTQVV